MATEWPALAMSERHRKLMMDTPEHKRAWATCLAAEDLACRLSWMDTPERFKLRNREHGLRTDRERAAAEAAFLLVRKARNALWVLEENFRVIGHWRSPKGCYFLPR